LAWNIGTIGDVDVDDRHNLQSEPLLYGGFTDPRKQGEPSVTLRTMLMDQGDTSSESGNVQRDFVT
jgi:hypothetical protein